MMDFLKVTTGIADDVLSLGNWMLKKLEAPGSKFRREEVCGLQAEVSIGIKNGGTGEIVVVQNNSLQHYPAQATDANTEFQRGTKVTIVDAGAHMMFVEKFEFKAQSKETVPVADIETVSEVHDGSDLDARGL